MKIKPGEKLRDRSKTEKRILEAAIRIIVRDGFTSLKVNAVAAEAGCDKKLITRYFGGLDGILNKLAGDLGLWVGPGLPEGPFADYAAFIEAMAVAYKTSLEANPVLQKVLAWELVEPSPTLTKIGEARSKAIMRWMAEARGDLAPPKDVDAPAINAVLLAAIRLLALEKATSGASAGIDLTDAENQARILSALRRLIRLAFHDPALDPA